MTKGNMSPFSTWRLVTDLSHNSVQYLPPKCLIWLAEDWFRHEMSLCYWEIGAERKPHRLNKKCFFVNLSFVFVNTGKFYAAWCSDQFQRNNSNVFYCHRWQWSFTIWLINVCAKMMLINLGRIERAHIKGKISLFKSRKSNWGGGGTWSKNLANSVSGICLSAVFVLSSIVRPYHTYMYFDSFHGRFFFKGELNIAASSRKSSLARLKWVEQSTVFP